MAISSIDDMRTVFLHIYAYDINEWRKYYFSRAYIVRIDVDALFFNDLLLLLGY